MTPIRVLHAEDDPDDAALIAAELARSGLAVDLRRVDTPEALARELERFRPEIVLCDYRMPRLDVPTALRLARAAVPDIPFLCVSGTVGEETAVDLLKLGVTDYVFKDRPARLVPSVLRALRETRDRRERERAQEELRRSREELVQAQKMEAVGRLAGGIAHDFNNVLTTISGSSELLLMALPPDSPHRKDVEEIIAASDRAAKLTRQLLAFGRRQVLEERVVDLNAVLRGLEGMLRRVITENVALELALAPDLLRVRADVGQLEQVVLNLAVNARDAMPRGGTLRLATRQDGDRVELAASDTGHGMSAEVKARIFEPFFTTKEKGRGTGLGLATVYGIVSQSGGSISVESAPGAGACFLIRLPSTAEPADPLRKRSIPVLARERGSEAVLVVEDEAPVRAVVRRMLESRGYRVAEAEDAFAALRLVEAGAEFDLAVVDVVMPGMDGASLVSRLRRATPGLRAVFVSGYADAAALPAPEGGKPFPFLYKPFTSELLLAKVREALAERPVGPKTI